MHHFRKELSSTLKHSAAYTARLLLQTLTNSWHLLKGQQILQAVIVVVITLIVNAYTGLLEFEKRAVNFESVTYFIILICVLVFITSLIAAPFNLDRERLEAIETRDQNIRTLEAKLSKRSNARGQSTDSQATITPTVSTPKTNMPVFESSKVYDFSVNLVQNQALEYDKSGKEKLFLVEFRYVNFPGAFPKVNVRAEVTVESQTPGVPHRTITGIWNNHLYDEREFIPEDKHSIIVAAKIEGELVALEHATDHPWQHEFQEILTPNPIAVDGNLFYIKVRLIGEHKGELVLNEAYWFTLTIGDADDKFQSGKGVI